jgi:hypothetical protein
VAKEGADLNGIAREPALRRARTEPPKEPALLVTLINFDNIALCQIVGNVLSCSQTSANSRLSCMRAQR